MEVLGGKCVWGYWRSTDDEVLHTDQGAAWLRSGKGRQPEAASSLLGSPEAPAWIPLRTPALLTLPSFQGSHPGGPTWPALRDPCEPKALSGSAVGGLKAWISVLRKEASRGARE